MTILAVTGLSKEAKIVGVADVVAVAESGIRDPDDARRLAGAGYDAILVGETLVRAPDRAAVLRSLIGYPVSAR